jgi:hypothetical protein
LIKDQNLLIDQLNAKNKELQVQRFFEREPYYQISPKWQYMEDGTLFDVEGDLANKGNKFMGVVEKTVEFVEKVL